MIMQLDFVLLMDLGLITGTGQGRKSKYVRNVTTHSRKYMEKGMATDDVR